MTRSINGASSRIRPAGTRPQRRGLAAALVVAAMAVAVPMAAAHGPGAAGGYGMGPGMMGGYGGYGMGPGMMDGYGGCGMGPGMMGGYGGYGGYGMGPGMMGGHGGYGMGPGMMGGYGGGGRGLAALDLSDEQRGKISRIQRDLRSKQRKAMDELHDQYERRAEATDDGVANAADDQIAALRQQMLGNANAARKEINAVLTKEQRRQLWRGDY